jgi:hypothetical protein
VNNSDDKTLNKQPCEEILTDEGRGKLIVDIRQVLHRPLHFLRTLGPLLTAHHPFCSQYDLHTISFRHRKWCIGCFFNSTSFFISFAILYVLWILTPFFINRFWLLYGGFVGVLVSFLMSAFHLTENKRIKLFSKLILGFSFAAICLSILIYGGDISFMLVEKALLIWLFYLPLVAIMIFKRTREIIQTCESCEYKMRWSKCPGFKDLICKLVAEEFLKPEVKSE